MSIELNHPNNTMVSDRDLTIGVKNKSIKGTVMIDASAVILPVNSNESGTYGVKSAIMFDDSIKRMKYHNGIEWITMAKSTDITDPINSEITNIKHMLDTKVDTVISGVSSVPMASISGTTLYINFPVSGGGGDLPEDQTGLFTNAPEGSIQGYSLLSGQTQENARDVLGDQSSSDGTQENPYVTTTGWCIADGNFWTWIGESGVVTRKVPNLNDQSPYLAGTPSNGRTITDRVIPATGQIAGHILTIDEMPRHKHGIRLSQEWGGTHDGAGYPQTDFSGPFITHSEDQPDYSYASGAGGNPLGSVGGNQPHTHGVNDLQPNHCNIIWMYNIAIPQAALTISKGDGRYVLKTGDNMTGSLGIQGQVNPTDYGNFDNRYVNKSGDNMAGSLNVTGRVTPTDYGNYDERYVQKSEGLVSTTTFVCPRIQIAPSKYTVDRTFSATTSCQYFVVHATGYTNHFSNKLLIYKNSILYTQLPLVFPATESGSLDEVTITLSVPILVNKGDTIRITQSLAQLKECIITLAS